MAVTEQSIRFAVKNIARYGDTDVFPFPLENHWFHDAEDDVVELLTHLDKSSTSGWRRIQCSSSKAYRLLDTQASEVPHKSIQYGMHTSSHSFLR